MYHYACDIKFVGINARGSARSAKTMNTLEIYPLYGIYVEFGPGSYYVVDKYMPFYMNNANGWTRGYQLYSIIIVKKEHETWNFSEV